MVTVSGTVLPLPIRWPIWGEGNIIVRRIRLNSFQFNNHLLSTFSVSGTVLGARDTKSHNRIGDSQVSTVGSTLIFFFFGCIYFCLYNHCL